MAVTGRVVPTTNADSIADIEATVAARTGVTGTKKVGVASPTVGGDVGVVHFGMSGVEVTYDSSVAGATDWATDVEGASGVTTAIGDPQDPDRDQLTGRPS